MSSIKLEDLQVYQLAMNLGEDVWRIVDEWSFFGKDTIGKQLVRAVDSIAANIAEGYGRYHFKENVNFCFYARGSLKETKTWLIKAHSRKLIPDEHFETLSLRCETLSVKLNNYIKTIGKTNI